MVLGEFYTVAREGNVNQTIIILEVPCYNRIINLYEKDIKYHSIKQCNLCVT